MSSIQTKYNFDFINNNAEVIEFGFVVPLDKSKQYIEFSNEKLHQKIVEIGIQSDVDLKITKIPDWRYLLPAEFCKEFFVGLLRTQTAFEKTISIPPRCVDKTLKDLVHNHLLEETFAELYKDAVDTAITTLDEYRHFVNVSRDPEKSIALAHYYLEHQKFDDALLQLIFAKEFLEDGELLLGLVDLKEFFQQFNSITKTTLFLDDDTELLLAAAKFGMIKTLSLEDTNFDLGIAERIGLFIENTQSLEIFECNTYNFWDSNLKKLNHAHMALISDGVRKNKTIEEISIKNTPIGNLGISHIIKAISENDELPITKLTLTNCGEFINQAITVENVKDLVTLIGKRQSLKIVEFDHESQRLIDKALELRDDPETDSLCCDLSCILL